MAFDLEGARKAGYSDTEIASFLAPEVGLDLEEARKAGYSDSEIVAQLAPPRPERGIVSEVGTQLYAGATIDLPKMVGQAMQWMGAEDTGKSLADWATEREKANPDLEPQLENRGFAGKALSMGARAMAPSVAAMIPAAALAPLGGVAAIAGSAAGAAGLFGASQAQDTYEKVKAAGGSDEDAKTAGYINGLIEAAGETAGNIFGYKLFGIGAKALGAGTAKDVIQSVTGTSVVKPFLRQLPSTLAVESGTEFGQNFGEAWIERAYGVQNGETPLESGTQGALAALGMTALLAPFGLGGFAMRARSNAKVANALQDPQADPAERIAASKIVYDALQEANPEAAKVWAQSSAVAISKNLPISLEEPKAPAPAPLTDQVAAATAKISEISQAQTLDEAIQKTKEAVDTVDVAGTVNEAARFAMEGRQVLEAMERKLQEDEIIRQAREQQANEQLAVAQATSPEELQAAPTAMQLAFQAAKERARLKGGTNAIPEQGANAGGVQRGAGPGNAGEGERVGGGNAQHQETAGAQAETGINRPAEVAKLPDTPEQARGMTDEHLQAARDLSRSDARRQIIDAEIARRQNEASAAPATPPRVTPSQEGVQPGAAVPPAAPILAPLTILGRPVAELPEKTLRVAAAKAKTPEARQAAQAELDRRMSAAVAERAPQAQDLRRFAHEAGWEERGGKIIRENAVDYKSPVVGRTKWIPKAEWFQRMRSDLGANGLSTRGEIDLAVNRYLAGKPLSPKYQRTVDWMLKEIETERDAWAKEHETPVEGDVAVEDVTQEGVQQPTGEDLAIAELFAAAERVNADEAARIALQYDGDQDLPAAIAALKEIAHGQGTVSEAVAGREEGGRAPQGEARAEPAAEQRPAAEKPAEEVNVQGRQPASPAVQSQRAEEPGVSGRASETESAVPEPSGQRGARGPERPALELQQQTPSDLAAKAAQQAAESAAAAAQSVKDAVDAMRGSFTLTGSSRPADEAAARGQMELTPPSPALAKANAASAEFRKAQEAYRANKISDDEFLAAKRKYDESEREFSRSRGELSPSERAITDFGEKIGGARKDTSRPLGSRGQAEAEESAEPGWRKRFSVSEIAASTNPDEKGKWAIHDLRSKDWKGQPRQVGQPFASKEDAEKAVELAAVALKHRVAMNRPGVDGKSTYSIWRDVTDRKRVKVVPQDFDTREDAMRYMAEHAVEIIETKTAFGEEILAKPDKVTRKGAERRTGPATANMFSDTFGFRGVEFGNWNNQEERQDVMNHAYDGLLDLAEVLGLPPKALSLNGELALAFGARGQGLSGAKAHYEMDYGVINLTKMTGAGSLAHEWFHAFDHYLARQDTKAKSEKVTNERGDMVYPDTTPRLGFASHGFRVVGSKVRAELQKAYTDLVQTMFTKAEQYVEDTQKAEKFVGDARERLAQAVKQIRDGLTQGPAELHYMKRNNKPASAEQLATFDQLAEKLISGQDLATPYRPSPKSEGKKIGSPGWMAGRRTNDTLEAMSAVIKAVRGRSGFTSEGNGPMDGIRQLVSHYAERIKMLESANAKETKTKRVPTSYAMENKRIDQGRASDYWTTEHEMAARAFSAYVEDKVAEQGNRSDFLAYGADNKFYRLFGIRPFPEGAERVAINAAFDKFIGEIKTAETDKGVVMFSRQAAIIDRLKFKTTTNKRDMPVFYNGEIGFANAESLTRFQLRDDEGNKIGVANTMRFRIFDTQKRDAKGKPTGVGWLISDVKDGQFLNIRSLQIDREHRQQGKGYGETVVASMLASNKPGSFIDIIDIVVVADEQAVPGEPLVDARGFWKAMGAEIVNYSNDPSVQMDGYISKGLYLKARGAKLSRASENQKREDTLRPEGERAPAARAEAALGGSETGRAEGGRRSGRGAGQALSVGQFRAAVSAAFGRTAADRLLDSGIVVPVPNQDQLPSHVVPYLRTGDTVYGFYDPQTDRTYAVLENLTPEDVKGLVLHEVGVHYGFERMLGDKYQEVLRQVDSLHRLGNREVREARATAEAESASPGDVANETLAYLVQNHPEMGIVRRIIAAVKAFLFRELGIGNLTTDDISMLARAAVMKAGLQERQGELAPAFARASDQTEAPAFKRWFGDSKVVDENGQPRAVYHGTWGDFDSFDTGATFEKASFFTENPKVASAYAKTPYSLDEMSKLGFTPNVVPAYLAIQKPMAVTAKQIAPEGRFDQEKMALAIKVAKDGGFDGLKITGLKEEGGRGVQWAVFKPEQIKSSTGNRGTFERGNPDIRFSRGVASAATFASTRAVFSDIVHSDRRLNRVISKFNTPFHIAETNKDFKPVYDEAQDYTHDVSRIVNESADLAKDLLPRIESLADFKKQPPSNKDVEAIANALYAGTLWGGGSPMDGRVWTDDELKSGRAEDANGMSLPAFEPLTEKQGGLYRQALASVGNSLTEHSKSLIWRLAKMKDIFVSTGMDLEDVAISARQGADSKIAEIKAETAMREGSGSEAKAERMVKQIRELEAFKESVTDIEQKTNDLIEHGYFPAMRFGQYAVNVDRANRDGTREELFFGRYETQLAANLAKKELEREFSGARVTSGVMNDEAHKLFQGLNLDALQLFAEHMTDEEGNPISADPVMQEYFRIATTERSSLKRQIHRKGTPGFSRDVPRALAQFTVSQATSASRNLHAAGMLQKVRGIKSGDLQAYATRYVRYLQDPQEESPALRGFLANYYILGSIAFGAVNMTQPVLMTAPYLTQYTSWTKAMAQLGHAARDLVTGRRNLTQEEKDAYARASKDGVVSPQEIHQIRAETRSSMLGDSPIWQKIEGIAESKGVKLPGKMLMRKAAFLWGSIYAMTEQFNRGTTFLAAYRIAKGRGMGQGNAYELARKAVDATQGVYARSNRPEVSRGQIGSVVMTFKQFNISYLELAKRLYDRDKKAFAVLMLTLFALAGSEGLPFVEDIEDLIDTIGQWLGYGTNSKKKLRQLATDLLGSEIADVMLHGASAIPGVPIDVANRMGMHNIIPGSAMLKTSEPDKARDIVDILGPAATVFKNVGSAIEGVATGRPGETKLLLPLALQNVGKSVEMAETGVYKDVKGRKVMDVDAMDAFAKFVGFQPAKVARESRIVSQNQQDIAMQKVMEDSIASKWARGINEHDQEAISEARQEMRDWNADNPELKVSINYQQLARRVKELRATREQRFLRSAPKEIRGQIRQDLLQ